MSARLEGAALSVDQFLRDVERHQLTVLREDGVYRHLRFKRPDEGCMRFDLLTWPGVLCFTGDMGTYVFSRLHDMLEFFRRDPAHPFRIDFGYWAEKVEARDRDGVKEFSVAAFKRDVRDYFEQATDGDEGWPDDKKAELWEAIEADVIDRAGHWEGHAFSALYDFEHEGFRFVDWERSSEVYTFRFLWCCHALAWGIKVYDEAKRPQERASAEEE